ncbi:MAG TPA: hypothetical protein VF982_12080, partial [Anaerolineales bacterium]
MTGRPLSMRLLGSPFVECAGEPFKAETRKTLALLMYLAVTGEQHGRDALATLFWPDSDQSHARGALRRVLSPLKTELGDERLIIDREFIELQSQEDFWLDVQVFRDILAARLGHGHPEEQVCPACLTLLIEAANLYRGDFLAGFTLPDSPLFDDWQYFEREDLRQEMTNALERLVSYLSAEQQ